MSVYCFAVFCVVCFFLGFLYFCSIFFFSTLKLSSR